MYKYLYNIYKYIKLIYIYIYIYIYMHFYLFSSLSLFDLVLINPFHDTGLFLYPLKISKTKVFQCFLTLSKETSGIKCVNASVLAFNNGSSFRTTR